MLSGVLLVEWDVGLLALGSQGQTALLQLGLGVIPVLVQNKLLQHTERTKHMCSNYFHKLLSKDSEANKNQRQLRNSRFFGHSCFYFISVMTH